MDGRPTGTPPPDSLRAAWSGHLRDQRRVVLNLRHLTVLQTPKTGQNDTILGVLFVQMHKVVLRSRTVASPSSVPQTHFQFAPEYGTEDLLAPTEARCRCLEKH
jgi:hypothetical protein